jgi:hypothetical protein
MSGTPDTQCCVPDMCNGSPCRDFIKLISKEVYFEFILLGIHLQRNARGARC